MVPNFDSLLPEKICRKPRRKVRRSRPLRLEEAIAAHISEVLRLTNGKIQGPGGAAELLGVNPNTLRWRIDKLGISYQRKKKGTAL